MNPFDKPERKVNDAELREYLLTWLMMYGRKWCDSHEAYEVDKAVGDYDEEDLWRVAMRRKYLSEKVKFRQADGKPKWHITPKGMRFINEVNEGSQMVKENQK